MNIQVLQEDLIKALNTSSHFVSTKPQLPILGNFLLEVGNLKLGIRATNLEMSVSSTIGAKIEKEGSVAIPAKTFLEIISNLRNGPVSLILEKEQLIVENADFKGQLTTNPVNDFPKIPNVIDSKKSFTLESSKLIDTLSEILFSCSQDETRPILTGVLFIFKDKKITLVSSDGFRLSKKEISLEKALSSKIEGKKIVIPRSSLIELTKIAKEEKLLIFELKEDENQLIIKIGETFVTSRLIEGEFPNFEKIIPSSSTTRVFLSKEDLKRAIKLSSVFARADGGVVKITINEDSVQISSQNAAVGKDVSKVEAKVEGGILDISFNFKFLEEFLNQVEGEGVEINLTDSVSPAIFVDPKNKEFLHLIMPVRIQS